MWLFVTLFQEEELEKLRELSEQNQKLVEQNEQYRQVTVIKHDIVVVIIMSMNTLY